jgi:hypothetical protein
MNILKKTLLKLIFCLENLNILSPVTHVSEQFRRHKLLTTYIINIAIECALDMYITGICNFKHSHLEI